MVSNQATQQKKNENELRHLRIGLDTREILICLELVQIRRRVRDRLATTPTPPGRAKGDRTKTNQFSKREKSDEGERARSG
jgi:hypothetical protein